MGNTISSGLKFRWLNGQSFAFRFPNGKTLITDPWFLDDGSRMAEKCVPGFSMDQIDACDYVFLNHGHGDHTAHLQQVVDKFHPVVMTHSAVCMELAKTFRIPLTSIYPLDFEGTYYFDGFILETHHGTHHPINQDYTQCTEHVAKIQMPGSPDLNAFGSMFNINFVLTTQEGLRIAFVGGNDDGMIQRLQDTKKPNVIIRNKMASSNVKDHVAEDFAAWFAATDTQLLIPMHYETWLTEDPEFAKKMIADMNRILLEKGKVGRVAAMERGKWYSLNLTITEEEN